jgi:hypothetical protein
MNYSRIYEIPEHVEMIEYEKGKINDQTIIITKIKDEERSYIINAKDFDRCECGQRHFKFGYIESNNSMNVYCLHCNKKYSKGLKQLKNKNSRTNKHLYYADEMKDAGRYFCEVCFADEHLKVHHIKEVRNGGSDERDNLCLLCEHCHNIVHSIRKVKGV